MRASALAHLGCYKSINTTALSTTDIYFSQFWRLAYWVFGESFLDHRYQLFTVFSSGGKATELSGFSFTKTLVPFIRASPSWPNHLSIPLRFQHKNLKGEGYNIQTIKEISSIKVKIKDVQTNHLKTWSLFCQASR